MTLQGIAGPLGRLSPIALMVRRSGRSWWQAGYQGGRVLSEWDTPPGAGRGAMPDAKRWGESRWEEVPKRGMLALRLLCPDGTAAVLETDNPDGRFIQLKQGHVTIGIGGAPSSRGPIAHLIGVVGDDLAVSCWAWELAPHAFALSAASGRCVTCCLAWADCGGREVAVRLEEELVEWIPDLDRPEAVERSRITRERLIGTPRRLIRWVDDLRDFRYRDIGRAAAGGLSLAVQGVRL